MKFLGLLIATASSRLNTISTKALGPLDGSLPDILPSVR